MSIAVGLKRSDKLFSHRRHFRLRAYMNRSRGVRIEKGDLIVSKIYGWYREDFGESKSDVLIHIRKYPAPGLPAALEDRPKIGGYEYDWSLNEAHSQ